MNYTEDKVFCQLIHLVINSEGGYVNDPKDPGGATKYGIAFNFNQNILKSIGVTEDKMKDLTYEQACQIYFVKYWIPSGAESIADVKLAYIHLDAAINCGIGAAQGFIKRLSRNPKYFAGNGENELLWMRLFTEYLTLRMNYYTHIKNRKYYLEGWINRLVQVSKNALTLKV